MFSFVTKKGAAAGRMRAGDMTEGAAVGKMPGVENIRRRSRRANAWRRYD